MTVLFAHVGGGTLAPLQILPLLAAALLYVRRTRTLAAEGRPVPVWARPASGSAWP